MSIINPEIKITALAPWYGAARLIAKHVGEELEDCSWVGVPFAGGLTELLYLRARTIVASDLHRHMMNLACVVAWDLGRKNLVRNLKNILFHPDTLGYAQQKCLEMERGGWTFDTLDTELSECWALNFFICAWMGRNGKAGTDAEFKGNLSIRWDAGGGDSCGRFRSAVRSLAGWRAVLRRCTFQVLDAFAFLDKCQDKEGHGLYIDAPWPDDGDDYRHKFTPEQHERLAKRLAEFRRTRVVIRFGRHPLIERLYPESQWTWREISGRTQANKTKAEALILNGPSRAEKGRLF